jgi:hypothetical protein
MKNAMERITYRLHQAEERISGIEDKIKELLQSDNNKAKNKKAIMTTTLILLENDYKTKPMNLCVLEGI